MMELARPRGELFSNGIRIGAGLIAFLFAFIGTVTFVSFMWAMVFSVLALAERAPEYVVPVVPYSSRSSRLDVTAGATMTDRTQLGAVPCDA
jgi:hypothetical protein